MDLLEKNPSAKRHPWEIARFKIIKELTDKQINSYEGKIILDIGCGDLYFLTRFAKDKANSSFFAVDTAFTETHIFPQKNNNIKTLPSLNNLPENENFKVDILFLLDVIEHVENDQDFLQDLLQRSFIHQDTLFVITAPAYNTLFSSYDRFLGHYRRFTNHSLEKLTKNAGLDTVTKGYFFLSLLIIRSFEVILEKIRRKKGSAKATKLGTWNKNHLITTTLMDILLIDYKINLLLKKIGFPAPGLSNYILCKKLVSLSLATMRGKDCR